MKLTVIGTGYVGLVLGTCLAELGNDIICLDIDEKKIAMLKKGKSPIYEQGLEELLKRNLKEKRLDFSTDKKKAIQHGQVIFIAVGTPMGENHEADLRFVQQAAKDIAQHMQEYKVVVNKSTVPVGTADVVKGIITKEQKKAIPFDVVSNPEFQREGTSVKDFQVPERVIIGTDSEKARDIMEKLYSPVARTDHPILFTDIKSAELIKYASNAMLATRISFMNELSQLSEKVGADIKVVARGMGLDSRIGSRFLQAGIGYGGSCFPKDVQALIQTMKKNGCETNLLSAVETVNKKQKDSILKKVDSLLPSLKGKTISVWGLSFKPKTDDIREAPALYLIDALLKKGAKIQAFDPVAQENTKRIYPQVTYAKTPYDAAKNADLLVIVTEWDEFRLIDKEKVFSLMRTAKVIDARNIWDPKEMKGFKDCRYVCVGR